MSQESWDSFISLSKEFPNPYKEEGVVEADTCTPRSHNATPSLVSGLLGYLPSSYFLTPCGRNFILTCGTTPIIKRAADITMMMRPVIP